MNSKLSREMKNFQLSKKALVDELAKLEKGKVELIDMQQLDDELESTIQKYEG